jgi:hypothetical protein
VPGTYCRFEMQSGLCYLFLFKEFDLFTEQITWLSCWHSLTWIPVVLGLNLNLEPLCPK